MAESLTNINHKIVYIAGPMSLYEETVVERFTKAEEYLHSIGYEVVISPLRYPEGLHKNSYMDISFAYIRAACTIFMLRDWEKAGGAVAEYAYAKQIDKNILFSEHI